MKLANWLSKWLILGAVLSAVTISAAHAGVREEHVTGGVLDLVWQPGFAVPNNLQALTLTPADPAYANPSGDHTVGNAINSPAPSEGGIILSCTDPAGLSDYTWEGWVNMGDGSTRRGLVVRADPTNQFQSCFQLVIFSGLGHVDFRKLISQAPTTLGTWNTTALPGGFPQPYSWHHMKIEAVGGVFRCWWDATELTAPPFGVPILDNSLPGGWVGVYNFRFDLGGVPVYFDDLILDGFATPTRPTSWGAIKSLYRN